MGADTQVQPGVPMWPSGPAPVQPGEVRQRRQRTASTDPQFGEGDLYCGQCGAGNAATRRFCRQCGASLAEAQVVRLSWWRRLLNRLRRNPRPAGYRPRRREGVRPVWIVLAVVLLIVAVVVLTPGLRHTVADRTMAGVNSVRDRMSKPVVIAARNPKASSTRAGQAAGLAVDAATDTFWAPEPVAPAVGQWVEADLESRSRVVSVIITPGISTDRPVFLTQARPKVIDLSLRAANGKVTTRTLRLKDQAGPQTFKAGASDVVAIRLTIKEAYGAEPGRLIGIAELEVFVRP
jgi:hypothetical protein